MSDQLKQLVEFAEELRDRGVELERLQDEGKQVSERIRRLEEVLIPELMGSIGEGGISSFSLGDGSSIQLLKELKAGVLKKKAGLDWLRENGEGGLIKTKMTVPFAKGQEDDASKLKKELEGRSIKAELVSEVHAGSLKSVIKRMLEAGQDVPLSDLGVHPRTVAKVKISKK